MKARSSSPASSRSRGHVDHHVEVLLEFFYPIHYRLLMALEDVLRGDQVSRKQMAILWLLRCEGGERGELPRKEIERLLTRWFEVTSSAITKALRGLTAPPLRFVKITRSTQSGREKTVVLTPKGREVLAEMVNQGHGFVTDLVAPFSPDTVDGGIRFLAAVTDRLDDMHVQRPARSFRSARKPASRNSAKV